MPSQIPFRSNSDTKSIASHFLFRMLFLRRYSSIQKPPLLCSFTSQNVLLLLYTDDRIKFNCNMTKYGKFRINVAQNLTLSPCRLCFFYGIMIENFCILRGRNFWKSKILRLKALNAVPRSDWHREFEDAIQLEIASWDNGSWHLFCVWIDRHSIPVRDDRRITR